MIVFTDISNGGNKYKSDGLNEGVPWKENQTEEAARAISVGVT